MAGRASRIPPLLLLLLATGPAMARAQQAREDRYLGQAPPGEVPQVFGKGIVSTEHHEFANTISPDGRLILFTRRTAEIPDNRLLLVRFEGGSWSQPAPPPFARDCREFEPNFSPDGRRLYFNSRRPLPEGVTSEHPFGAWVATIDGGRFGEPQYLGPPFSTIFPMFVTEARSGTLYATGCVERGIYKCVRGDSGYRTPERLSETVHISSSVGHPYIAPDESLLLFDSNVDSDGTKHLYASFRQKEGEWGRPHDLTELLDFPAGAMPHLTFDEKYLFFSCLGDIYWVDAAFLERLRDEERAG